MTADSPISDSSISDSVHGSPASTPVTLPGTQQWTLHGDATHRDYLIQISVPDSPAPADGYPVLYVLDGNARFPLAVAGREALTLRGPMAGTAPWLIVGVGYPHTLRFNGAARSEDYTPEIPGGAAVDPRGRPVGGAAAFLTFLERQLMPEIEGRFPVDASQRALLGHSYGGLFALYTALTRPELFRDYLAISPSLWWGDGLLYTLAPTPGDSMVRVLLGAGDQERASRPAFAATRGQNPDDGKEEGRTGTPAMCDNVACLADWLQQRQPEWQIEHRTFGGATHGNVMWPAMQAIWAFLDKKAQ